MASVGLVYAPWMASFTETVEPRNPALTATGLAIWGWIIRVVVFVAFLIIPHVITAVTPLVNYGATVGAYEAKYGAQLAFARPMVRSSRWRRRTRSSSPTPRSSRPSLR